MPLALLLSARASSAEEAAASASAPAQAAAPAVTIPREAEPKAASRRPSVVDLCSRSDPYIEYRDCVNAATRDPNAKVRDV